MSSARPSRSRSAVSAASIHRNAAVLWYPPHASVSLHSTRRWTRIDAGSRASLSPAWSRMARIEYASMRVGVGLPTTTPGATGPLLLEWARRADRGPFASLGVLDRVVYASFEPFAALGA